MRYSLLCALSNKRVAMVKTNVSKKHFSQTKKIYSLVWFSLL